VRKVRRTHPVTEIALHKFFYLISVLFRLCGDGSPGKQRPESKRTTLHIPCRKFLATPLNVPFLFSEITVLRNVHTERQDMHNYRIFRRHRNTQKAYRVAQKSKPLPNNQNIGLNCVKACQRD